MSFRACAVIPVFDHEHALPLVVQALRQRALPCVLVDDASSHACAQVMDELATQPDIHLLRLPVNQGKGGAVMAGLAEAQRLGEAMRCRWTPTASTTWPTWPPFSPRPRLIQTR